jgi:transglutaminase-like putative cysteine protease
MILFNKKAKKREINNKGKNNFCLSSNNAWLLWLCQCLNIAIIALELSTWILAVVSLSLAWRALLLHNGRERVNVVGNKTFTKRTSKKTPIISPFILGVFALLGCVAIAITAKETGILLSMVHLLCFSYVLKAFELKARSDFYQLLLLGLFILASSLIFRQDLAFTLITFTLLLINLSVLLQFFSSEKIFVTNIKIVAVLLGQSVILAVVLFLIFPRLSSFWQVPLAKSAETGLSDSVKPGDIANLTRSTKLAFRADFGQQTVPNYSQLYWRAMVLEEYDGREWTKKKRTAHATQKSENKSFNFNTEDTDIIPLNYQITVEPSFQKYLFALAPAVSANGSSAISAKEDYTFTSPEFITQAKSYKLNSYLSMPLTLALSNESKNANLRYPQSSNPRLEQMALQLQAKYPEPQARAQAVLSLINEENYSYTLQPPLLKNNSLDQFFFDTKAGFCVHYASTFTFIMRASGIPARLVTGYLGGEYNGTNNVEQSSNKGHLSIYQYDAHAWSEIWIRGRGWVRVDPTGAVDPQRINSGWSNELLREQSLFNNGLFSLYQLKNIAWLNALRLQFDALDYQWSRWVIGFTTKQQYNLFKNWFGEMVSWKLALITATALIVSMTMLMVFLHLLNRPKQKVKVLARYQLTYNKALNLLSKQGIEKPVAMTVNNFAQHVSEQSPELAISFTRLARSYNQLCYQILPQSTQDKLTLTIQQQYQQFFQAVKKLKRESK